MLPALTDDVGAGDVSAGRRPLEGGAEPSGGVAAKRRRKQVKAPRRPAVAPPGVPAVVFEHHWDGLHAHGQNAVLGGDVAYLLREASRAGCRDCVRSLLAAHPSDADRMITDGGRGGEDDNDNLWTAGQQRHDGNNNNDNVFAFCFPYNAL